MQNLGGQMKSIMVFSEVAYYIRSHFTHFRLDNDVKRTSKRRFVFKLLTKMVLNFLNFSTLSHFFIVKLFYSNHIFWPSCSLTLKIQVVFFLSVLLIYVFHDWLLCDRVNYEKQCAECRDLICKTKKDYFNTVISENIKISAIRS